MARSVSYGNPTTPEMNMHPFFRQGRAPDVLPMWNGSNPVIILPLSPRRENNAVIRTSVDLTSTTPSPPPPHPSAHIQGPRSNVAPVNLDGSSADDLESEPNSHRCKRRRISEDSQKSSPMEIPHEVPGSDLNPRSSQAASDEPSVPTAGGSPGLSSGSSQNPKENGSTESNNIAERGAGEMRGTAGKKTTPNKKKMLRIGANGTLSKSPKSASKQKTPPGASLKQSNKRVELKRGRLVSSLLVKLIYGTSDGSRSAIGNRINNILSGLETKIPALKDPLKKAESKAVSSSSKSTHPFFLGRPTQKATVDLPDIKTDALSTTHDSDDEVTKSPIRPKPWHEIKFRSNRPLLVKSAGTLQPPWPPRETQNVRPEEANIGGTDTKLWQTCKEKARQSQLHIAPAEDVLQRFRASLQLELNQESVVNIPERCCLTAPELLDCITQREEQIHSQLQEIPQHAAIETLTAKIRDRKSAFNRGVASDSQIWPIEHAPRTWQEVLQPKCKNLYNWLDNLKVHNVQKGIVSTHSRSNSRTRVRKKRPKRHNNNELEDFIADSDDDQADQKETKNAITLVGPSGCGKTASVYAVAQQLGFEVFEINPGMKRSAKDIFDRVGDMTRNHLVQRTAPSLLQTLNQPKNNAVPVPSHAVQALNGNIVPKQPLLSTKNNHVPSTDTAKSERHQKQSLILFEEVDLLYDDDKHFWSGVITLTQQSKRPVVLTCNNIATIPADQLPLHTILEYDVPPIDIVADLLVHVAAAESHWITRGAAAALYMSKNQDLRASLTELQFWCQMTVGSKQGGLDWMNHASQGVGSHARQNDIRVVSKDTYVSGLDLLPIVDLKPSQFLEYADVNLGRSASDLELQQGIAICIPGQDSEASLFDNLHDLVSLTDARSALDLVDGSCAPILGATIHETYPHSRPKLDRKSALQNYRTEITTESCNRFDIQNALFPLNNDPRVFPAPVGRTGPSVDTTSLSLVTEIAPFVRSIVLYEQRLAKLQSAFEEGESVHKRRKTRAARAAVEGGDKATTRRERWFPKELDFDQVVRTGANAVHLHTDVPISEQPSPASTASTVDVGDLPG